ncbi:hypothetical protein SELMODRAFT_427570 [Selaginella moellendorffii]|uniref:Pentatricopeptide repeat-containing protein n=1 Tax=Selaginella moellendorffii TaxID=88036 RepID=D8T010_SELML|nr:hypothetical protein SELMODRAFT_427570 [Selaginella moellendorffii]
MDGGGSSRFRIPATFKTRVFMLFRHVNGRKRSLGLGFCCIAGVVRSSSASNLEALLEAAESSPDRERISHLLKLCGHFKALPQAQRLHRLISSSDGDGRLDDGDYFFAAWPRMIARFIEQGDEESAMIFYIQMQRDGVKPDHFTLVTILNLCQAPEDLELGIGIHRRIARMLWRITMRGQLHGLQSSTSGILARVPDQLRQPMGCLINYNQITVLHNKLLRVTIDVLQASFGDSVRRLIYVAMNGNRFQNGPEACCGTGKPYNYDPRVPCGTHGVVSGRNFTARACSNPKHYMRWGGIHTTEAFTKAAIHSVLSSSLKCSLGAAST